MILLATKTSIAVFSLYKSMIQCICSYIRVALCALFKSFYDSVKNFFYRGHESIITEQEAFSTCIHSINDCIKCCLQAYDTLLGCKNPFNPFITSMEPPIHCPYHCPATEYSPRDSSHGIICIWRPRATSRTAIEKQIIKLMARNYYLMRNGEIVDQVDQNVLQKISKSLHRVFYCDQCSTSCGFWRPTWGQPSICGKNAFRSGARRMRGAQASRDTPRGFCSKPRWCVDRRLSSMENVRRQIEATRIMQFTVMKELFEVPRHQVLKSPPSDANDAKEKKLRWLFNEQLSRQRQFDFKAFHAPNTKTRCDAPSDSAKQHDSEFFWGKISVRGRRGKMEDELTIIDHFGEVLPAKLADFNTFFGIYDGHRGRAAPNFCKLYLHYNTAFFAASGAGAAESLLLGHERTEMEFTRGAALTGDESGSTAISVLLNSKDRRAIVANLGDSRAVICRAGRLEEVTCDHTPLAESERERVEAEGGSVTEGRVGGTLAVSRSFGDLDAESGHKLAGLSSSPDVVEVELGDDFEFLLVGCDGCWEVCSTEWLGRETRRLLTARGCPQLVVEELVKQLMEARHATDNLTMILIAQRRHDESTRQVYFGRKPRARRNWSWGAVGQSPRRPNLAVRKIMSFTQ